MRLFSALLAGLTTLCVFGFLRELLPRYPPTWTVGALAAGLTPLFGFISGGVNNDAGLFLAGAATLWALAHAFRSGLGTRSGLLIGMAFGLGLLTKATLVALAPGLVVAGVVLLRRQWRTGRREALLGLGTAAAAIALPVVFYFVAIHTVWDRPLWSGGIVSGGDAAAGARSLRGLLSYLWQFYLPRLPGMHAQGGGFGLKEVWFKGWIGRFGWLDYGFPTWVYWVAAGAWVALLAFAARALWMARPAVRARVGELAAYAAMLAGLLLVAGVQGYGYRLDTGFGFEQTRYLLPLLGLYAAVIALAVIGAGRRWRPAVGTGIVALTLIHGLGALLLTVGRYYT
jgi:4-amino-4-deoxy-L-arabinose transferase-like glycosyltransferase